MDDVIIVGAGPTGLMVACELALGGVSCRIVERRAEEPNITRAFALHARALELLDARGMGDELVARGNPLRAIHPAFASSLEFGQLDTRYPMLLLVPQNGTEQLLEQRAVELGVPIMRGATVVDLEQDADGVHLELADGATLNASYVIGADGAHSTVRDRVNVGFIGNAKSFTLRMLLADVRIPEHEQGRLRIDMVSREGAAIALPFGDGWFRVGTWISSQAEMERPPDIAEIRAAFQRIAGTDFGMSEPRWISRFVTESRQARSYRAGRVFLVGDAAHINSPMGGQGMNTGIQDAFNLGWKLAATVKGWAPPSLLDSYHQERHPVGTAVLAMVDQLTRTVMTGSRLRLQLLRTLAGAVLRTGPGRRAILGRLSGLEIAYPPREKGVHRLVGRRASDVRTDQGRLYEVLRDGRFVLLTRDGTAHVSWSDRVRPVRSNDPSAPAAMLIRPDAYVAWADNRAADGDIRSALMKWCGPGDARDQEDSPHRATA